MNNNRVRREDKKSVEQRLATESSNDYQDYMINESGTIIEY